VARKLGIATGLMFTFPIFTFYLCFHVIFASKAEPLAWSGFAAVGAANVVIAGYVYSAFSEPDDEEVDPRSGTVKKVHGTVGDKDDSIDSIGNEDDDDTDNDASGPRVGAFKQRTD
jgi:hypothetical protein